MQHKIKRLSVHNMDWFRTTFQLRGSVVSKVLPRLIAVGLVAGIIYLAYLKGYNVAIPILASVIPNIVIGLLLVFRTNTAYERYWEGRKLWGSITNASRNLARELVVNIPTQSTKEVNAKNQTLELIGAFATATKLHLRKQDLSSIQKSITPELYTQISDSDIPPLGIMMSISDYLQGNLKKGTIDTVQYTMMQALMTSLVDSLGGCERILKTPIPLAYSIHLKQLLVIYAITLPFQFVGALGWWSIPIVMLVSFTLFGIEEIGAEIENPFGKDLNDLPLDTITQGIKAYIQSIKIK